MNDGTYGYISGIDSGYKLKINGQMTPEEKALELCQRFGYLAIKWEQTNYTTLALDNAKQCALIAVDEILENNKWYIDHLNDKFWQEVKNEIKKL